MSNCYRAIKLFAFVTGLCAVSSTRTLAQQSLFVYLQSDNLQPFYVQLDDKVYSSSNIGHLVISGLIDKTCNFEIGFPQQATQPQRFAIPLRNRDHGFQLIKNSKGWALLDLQTDETIKPQQEASNSNLLYGVRKRDDAFAALMAAVVNDSAVLYTSIVKKAADKVPTVDNDVKPVPSQDAVVKKVKPGSVTVANLQATVDSSGQMKPNPVPDSAGQQNSSDTLVTKYDPKERGLTDQPVTGGVAKIHEQTKNGETKIVFVDSSETPAKVVIMYITEDKNESKQQQEPKDSGKTVLAPEQSQEQVAAQTKKDSLDQAMEKKLTADTLTVELESPQIKKSTIAQPEPVKPVSKDTATAQLFDPGKMQVEVVTGNAVVKEEPVKPASEDSSVKSAVTPINKEKEEPAKDTPKAVMLPAIVQKDTETVAVAKPADAAKSKAVEPEKKEETAGKVVMINSDCSKLATENDIDKMRVKLMAEGDEQKRLAIANKYFKTMCLYAKQIKALSELFAGDEAKYKFLEMAYPFAADTANFKQLYELFSDDAYVTRFKKLVRLQ